MLTVVGCGGSDTNKKDAGDGGATDTGEVGQTPKANLTADRATVSVGNVDVGKPSTPVIVKITNSGNASATLTVTPTDVVATGCPATLAMAASCSLSITATPTVAGKITGSVSVSATGANTLLIGVTGEAMVPGNFSFSPSTVEIGDLAAGTSKPAVITVTAITALTGGITSSVNGAGTNLKIDSTTCSSTGPMTAGATCTINVTFSSTASTTPGRITTDSVSITQGGVTRAVPVYANVLALAKLVATPSTAAMAAAPGETSAPIQINIGNIGGVSTGQVVVQFTGDKAADFRIVDDKCSITQISPNGTCTVTVSFAPAATVVATETVILTVTDKGPGLSSVNVSLTGTPTLPSSLAITGGPSLGSVTRGTTGAEVLFTVTNSSATPSGGLTTSIGDANIIISSNTCATVATLNKGETCTVGLKLNPAATATPTSIATLLTVSSASGKASASVTGTIVGSAALSASPTSISFDSVPMNQFVEKSVNITNTGATATGVLSITKTGVGAAQVSIVGDTCSTAPLSPAPALPCSITVRYSPTDTAGVNGSISVTDGIISVSVPMVGTGLAPVNFAVSAVIPMQTRPVGYTSTPQEVEISLLPTATTDTGMITFNVTGDNPSDFTVVNNCLLPVVPSANCKMVVTFTPSDVGERKAVLNIKGEKGGTYPVQLTGTGLSLVALEPFAPLTAPDTGLVFNPTPNGSKGNALHYKVTVRGGTAVSAISTVATVVLGTQTTAADFVNVTDNTPLVLTDDNFTESPTNQCNAATLALVANTGAAAGTAPTANWKKDTGFWVCDFWVQFRPQTGRSDTTPKTATVTANGSAGGTSNITLTGTATGPLLFASRASTDVLTLDLWNKGETLSQGPITISLSNTNDFAIVTDECTSLTPLAPGTSCQVILAFTPTSSGQKEVIVTATANNPDPREDQEATATVTGVSGASYSVTISPNSDVNAPVDMGTVVQDATGEWKQFTISNPDGAPKTTTLYYEVTGAFELYDLISSGVSAYPSGYCGNNNTKALEDGEECIIAVRFKPVNTSVIGVKNGTLVVRVGGPSGTLIRSIDGKNDIALKGTATSQLTISPPGIDFGDVAASVASTPEEVTVTNNGLHSLTLSIETVTSTTNPNVSNVSATAINGGCPNGVTLAAGTSCKLRYQFSGATPGTNIGYLSGIPSPRALLVSASNAGVSVSAQVTVQGKVVTPASLARYGGSDINPINLGNAVVGASTGPVTLYFTNTGEAPATGIIASLPVGTTDFAILTEGAGENPCNSLPVNTLQPDEICSVKVQFTPAIEVTSKTTTLSVTGAGLAGVLVGINGGGHGASSTGAAAVFAEIVGSPNQTFATLSTPTAIATTTSKVYFTLTNKTTGNIAWTNIVVTGSTSGEFTKAAETIGGGEACSTTNILPNVPCQFSVTFTPAAYGADDTRRYRWATVSYQTNAIAGVMAQVQKPAKLQLSATTTDQVIVNGSTTGGTVNFGQVLEGSSKSFNFTIKNIGEVATAGAVTPTLTPAGGGGYANVTHDCGTGPLAPNASCTATVTVSSNIEGHYDTASIQAKGASTEDSAETFDLDVQVVRQALIGMTLTSGAFTPAGTYVGDEDTQTVTYTVRNGVSGNTSDNRQDSGALNVSLSNATDFTILTASSSCYNTTTGLYKVLGGMNATDLACTIVVQFNPRSVGPRTATLLVTATPGTPQSVTLAGTGLADLTITDQGTAAAPVALGVGTGHLNQYGTFTITNNGPSATSLLTTTLGGTNSALFRITDNQCVGKSLTAAGSPTGTTCDVKVTFIGTATATAQTATLTVTDGSTNNNVIAYTKVVL